MSMKIPVPVFDSSQIEIPNPPPIKFSSFEGQSLTAWRPSGQQKNIWPHQRTTANGDRPNANHINGQGSPREKSTDILLEGRASPQAQHKRSLVPSKKWVEPALDKRSKTILDVLQSKRASKQSETANADIPDGITRSTSGLGSVNSEITKDKVIRYPKFVVREKKKSSHSENKKQPKSEMDTRTFTRSQSMRHQRKQDYVYGGGGEAINGMSDIYREADARRSYRPYRTGRASLYEHSGIPVYSPNPRQSYTNRERPVTFESFNDQSIDDIIMGFFPEDKQEYLQAKSMNTSPGPSGSAGNQKPRSQSPPYEHVPPPPTPASQLLMQLGVDPNDPDKLEEELRYEERLQLERRKTLRERSRNRDKSSTNKRDKSDPGVSNTTHQLLESNIVKRNFVFPHLTKDSHRKSLTTPRSEEKLQMYRMSPSSFVRPKFISKNGNVNNGQFVATPVQSYDVNDSMLDTREKSASKIDLSQSHDQLATQEAQRSQSSIGMASGMIRSHSFYHGQKKPDKYARMISLGLPKVNIDIDRKHFAQENRVRRSIELREKYQIPDNLKDVKVGEQDNSKYIKKSSPTKDEEMDNDDKRSNCSNVTAGRIDTSGDGSGDGERMRLPLSADLLAEGEDRENNRPECSSHIQFRPPPNTPISGESNVFQRRSTVRKKSSKIPVKSKSQKMDQNKGAVGVSYFKMIPPGEKTEPDGTKLASKPSDAQKYAYGVTLASDEIAL